MPATTVTGSPPKVGPGPYEVAPRDVEFFQRYLRNFVPPDAFDVHGHMYALDHLGVPNAAVQPGPARTDWETYHHDTSLWMGDRAPTGGLFFPFPSKSLDFDAANAHMADQIVQHDNLRGLIIVAPEDDPDEIDRQIDKHHFSGIKVYHLFSGREKTQDAFCEEFLPEWAWEIADRRGQVIMLHIVRARSLDDPANQKYLREHCLRYRNAKVILAHAARGFCSTHTFDSIDSLRGLDNVFFDQSTVSEPHGIEAIFKAFGTTRMMFGMDYPISQLRGRCINIADSFLWLYHDTLDWQKDSQFAQHTLQGNECVMALKMACRNQRLTDSDVERVFATNARQLLGVGPQSDGRTGQRLYEEAKKIIPGGTQLLSKRPEKHAPDQWPAYYHEARGCQIVDLDGRTYTDMSSMSVGACALGYADPDVTDAVVRRVQLGSISSLNNVEEVELSHVLLEIHPWANGIRYARTGGESMAAAVRFARATTGRDVIAFCGYHGWHDWYLATNVGSGGRDRLGGHLMQGLSPAGVPQGLAGTALPFAYNKLEELEAIVKEHGNNLAAVVMEPIRYVDPKPGYLEAVRDLCDRCGAVLVFDEITIGWKLYHGGSHLRLGVTPDIAVYAKSLGNGHPIAAIVCNDKVAYAVQDTFVSSTYFTEGVGFAAALATIEKMKRVDLPTHLDRVGRLMHDAWGKLAADHGLPIRIEGTPVISHFSIDGADNAALDTLMTVRMLQRGYLAGFNFYASLAHEPRHIESYREDADEVFAELAEAIKHNDAESRIGGPVKQAGFARLL